MFTARDFLNKAPAAGKFRELRQQLKADPDRLRREFLVIAVNSKERVYFRATSLRVLSVYADVLNASGSSDAIGELIIAFKREFPPGKLANISAKMQNGRCPSDGFLAFQFCTLFVKLAPERAAQSIDAGREAFNGTELGAILARTIEANNGIKNS